MSICIGVGLATACGLRVFIPLLVAGVTSHFGYLPLAPGFQWMASTPALLAFAVAAGVEVAGYYIPWLDNALDAIASPAAVLAGTIVTVAVLKGMDPFQQWALGIIAGGGMAGLVQGTTVVARGASTVGTAGLANHLIATMELTGSILVSVLVVFVPLAVIAVLAIVAFLIVRWILRRKPSQAAPS
jgi:hypothetical protein